MKIQVTLILAVCLVLGFTSCEKYNQIDNASTVKTPYTLFIGGYNGTLHKTNDALYFNTLFPTDNACVRQVIIADSNILYLKQNLYASKNDGSAFKISNDHALDFIDKFYKYYYPNSGLYEVASRKVYFCTKTGLEFSSDLGETFQAETNYDVAPPAGKIPTSITQMTDGWLFVMFDSSLQYKKQGTGQWTQVVHGGANELPKDTTWYVSHSHDTLFAIDFFAKAGVYYSTNQGTDWTAVSGIPKKRNLLFGNEAFANNTFYIGVDSGGLYRLEGNSFVATGAGMPWFAKVSYVEGKRVTYRTGINRDYLFCATDQGLYISETKGLDWKLIKTGLYSTLK